MALLVCGSLVAGGIGLAAAQPAAAPDQPIREQVIQKYDTNGDGVLDANEKAAMRADFRAKRETHRAKMLAKWDANHDGKLEKNELVAMREARAEKMFKRLDVNGDGQLSFEEFQQARLFHPRGMFKGQRGGNGNQP
ncbi:MAG TPA: EF-hand domain-containing protein [Kofleriaceae bacterium]